MKEFRVHSHFFPINPQIIVVLKPCITHMRHYILLYKPYHFWRLIKANQWVLCINKFKNTPLLGFSFYNTPRLLVIFLIFLKLTFEVPWTIKEYGHFYPEILRTTLTAKRQSSDSEDWGYTCVSSTALEEGLYDKTVNAEDTKHTLHTL